MVRSLEFAAFAGRVVYVGITQQNLEFPHAPVMHRRELTLLASRIDTAVRKLNARLSGLAENTTTFVANIERESGTFVASLQTAKSEIATTREASHTRATAQLEPQRESRQHRS